MPKTAATKPRNVKNLVILTAPELKELIGVVEFTEGSYATAGWLTAYEKRFLFRLNRIKAKLRRGF